MMAVFHISERNDLMSYHIWLYQGVTASW